MYLGKREYPPPPPSPLHLTLNLEQSCPCHSSICLPGEYGRRQSKVLWSLLVIRWNVEQSNTRKDRASGEAQKEIAEDRTAVCACASSFAYQVWTSLAQGYLHVIAYHFFLNPSSLNGSMKRELWLSLKLGMCGQQCSLISLSWTCEAFLPAFSTWGN